MSSAAPKEPPGTKGAWASANGGMRASGSGSDCLAGPMPRWALASALREARASKSVHAYPSSTCSSLALLR